VPNARAIEPTSWFVPLNVIAEVREVTRRAPILERPEVTSSVRPSAKYSFSRSVLRFTKGRTAIDLTPGARTRRDPAVGRSAPRRLPSRQRSISDLKAYMLPSTRCTCRCTGKPSSRSQRRTVLTPRLR
jgi:hypothetical protein